MPTPDLDFAALLSNLQDFFDPGTLARASAYRRERRVTNCVVRPHGDCWLVTAVVRGSRPRPYVTSATIGPSGDDLFLETTCSCPMAVDCKHVAATLLTLSDLQQPAFPGMEEASSDSGEKIIPLRDAPREARLAHPLTEWLQSMERALAPRLPETHVPTGGHLPRKQVFYLLRPQGGRLKLELSVGMRADLPGRQTFGPSMLAFQPHSLPCATPDDLRLVRQVVLTQRKFEEYDSFLEGTAGAEMLQQLVATERCYWRPSKKRCQPLALGSARAAQLVWRVAADGLQRTGLDINPPVTELITTVSPPWFVDETAGIAGPVEIGINAELITSWLNAPPVTPRDSAIFAEALERQTSQLPSPRRIEVVELSRIKPVPCLRLYSALVRLRGFRERWGRRVEDSERMVELAKLEFDYSGRKFEFAVEDGRSEWFADGKIHQLRRRFSLEEKLACRLETEGLELTENALGEFAVEKHPSTFTHRQGNWIRFMTVTVPRLRADGWRIDIDDSFRFRVATPEEWYADAEPEAGGNDWFNVELGVMLDGERVNLLPILLKALQADPGLLQADALAGVADDELIPVPMPDGRKLAFPAGRAREMVGALLELLNPGSLNRRGRLRLPKLQAAELADEPGWRWMGSSELAGLCQRLKNFAGIKAVPPSPGLKAHLRPYQRDGLSWLQFLREYEIAGVLADDMGLGKTVQTLAHLLVEKAAGRMDRPSLIVAPTSLMTNWRQEVERFAPELRVLVLHGLERKREFQRIAEHDVVITSYPLLPRDQEVLREHEFHYLILDEAQFIKNPKTIYAQVACALTARHRLCLTGTPMENHLGELWSLFHFLLPGFLGDEIRFNSIFRRPIEKDQSDDRRKLLARRIAPFILRRKKEEVVKELPPKTEIVQNVELRGAQRDLYESVRLAMHARVKEEVDKKGISRAHIIILDALLKLRQICCHPQLLSLSGAAKVKESAKLELLLDLLPEMIEEGRRVLLFSQFTSMLAIIERELTRAKISYVRLAGDTRDRATPVQRFQNLEVPVFLISLKAGGTGLNLTAADTVIHYDPWWNPAVENQATDRAHRIGQDKQVFVYKLMTVGTVEEKILKLQARKRELVEGLLNEKSRKGLKITTEDLDVLFAPV